MLYVLLVTGAAFAGPPKGPMSSLLDKSKPMAERVKAAEALGKSKDPLAADTLVKVLDSMDEKLHDAVVKSLEQLGAAEKFSKRLADPNAAEPLKLSALVGLRHLKAESSRPALAVALKDASPAVRKEAALSLSVVGPEAAEESLIGALADADGDVRYFVAEALGGVKTPRAKEAVAKRLEVETNPTVKYALTTARDKQSR